MQEKIYAAIDLKSFYASVECKERGLNPLTTNLVVADASRTEKTICLAVTPSLKACGLKGRSRLFEVVETVKTVNRMRKQNAPNQEFIGKSYDAEDLKENPALELDYIIAPPRMAFYVEYSTRIYNIYLQYVAPEDIHVYSIDEVFIDITAYLKTYKMSAEEFVRKIIQDVFFKTGITATAGIGENLYLCKIAMDIVAKHMEPDENGVRVACLTSSTYRELLWAHRPITDFWRVGKGYAKRLAEHGLYTMGDVARCSIGREDDYYNEELLYKLFGVNAQLLIDHAWGYEPCTISAIKEYRPSTSSISSGQVLQKPYTFEKARLVLKEMLDTLSLDLIEKKVLTKQITLTIGYDIENLHKKGKEAYQGACMLDPYGRKIPKAAHGTANLFAYTSSAQKIEEKVLALYDKIVDSTLTIRRLTLSANFLLSELAVPEKALPEQCNLFSQAEEGGNDPNIQKERKMQETVLKIKKKYGKNSILKGMNLEEDATAKERNRQIGGHKA